MRQNRNSWYRGCNPEAEGMSRTLKANYWKVSVANFLHQNGWGATGAMVVYETE